MSANADSPFKIDPTLSTAALAGLEASINATLRFDPGTRAALEKLQGQILALESTAPSFTVYVQICNEEDKAVRLFADPEGHCTPTTHLCGSLSSIAALLLKDTSTLANSGVQVMGSTALLSELQTIAKGLDIDWEDALNQVTGDVLGHQVAEKIRGFSRWGRDRAQSGERLVSEYLTEELKSIPALPELQNFYAQVDDARMRVDRLEQKILKHLARKSK